MVLASLAGGIDVESADGFVRCSFPQVTPVPAQIGREVARQLGGTGSELVALGRVISRLVDGFIAWDALLLEVNPLVHTSDGRWVIADVHLELDDDAAYRQRDIQDTLERSLRADNQQSEFERKAYDAKGLIKSAIRDRNPVMFIENISLYATKAEVPDEEYTVPLGTAEVRRAGDDVTLIALSAMVPLALQAAEQLASEGISAEVIDPRSLAPLDIDTIVASVEKTGRAVVSHVAHKTGGVGAEIAQQITERAFDYLDGPVVRVAAKDLPIAASQKLEAEIFPDVDDLVAACKSFAS